MNGSEWIRILVEIFLGAVMAGILAYGKKLCTKLDALSEVTVGIRLKLENCVTWDDLTRELGPLKAKSDDHATRLARVETRCDDTIRECRELKESKGKSR